MAASPQRRGAGRAPAVPDPPPRTSTRQRVLGGEHRQQDPVTGPQSAAAAERGRDHQIRLGRHSDHPCRVAAGDDHPRISGQGQPVPRLPAQHAGHGPVSDPARLIHPAEPVHHVIRDRRDLRRDGDRQAVDRGGPAVLPCARPGRRGMRGAISGAVMAASPRGRGRGSSAASQAACSSSVCCAGNFPCLCVRGET
jgi:hypothetical protein